MELARTDARSRGSGGAGLFNVVSVVILVVGVLVIGIAAALLARTLAAAQSIDKKAQTIAGNAGNIDVATNSVIQLNRTNEVAASILQSAKPLQGLLITADSTARDIDGLAKSINGYGGNHQRHGRDDQRHCRDDQQYRESRSTATSGPSTAPPSRSTAPLRASTAGPRPSLMSPTASTSTRRTSTTLLSRTVVIARNIKIDSGNILNQAIRAERRLGASMPRSAFLA